MSDHDWQDALFVSKDRVNAKWCHRCGTLMQGPLEHYPGVNHYLFFVRGSRAGLYHRHDAEDPECTRAVPQVAVLWGVVVGVLCGVVVAALWLLR